MTQKELGAAAGLTDQRISDLEGESRPGMQDPNYRALAAALGLSAAELDAEVAKPSEGVLATDRLLNIAAQQNIEPQKALDDLLDLWQQAIDDDIKVSPKDFRSTKPNRIAAQKRDAGRPKKHQQ